MILKEGDERMIRQKDGQPSIMKRIVNRNEQSDINAIIRNPIDIC